MVDIGVKAFFAGSQIDLHPVRDLDSLVGEDLPLKIIKINHRRGNVVVSRRVLLEETRDRRRQTTLSTLKEGQLIPRERSEHHRLRSVHRPRRHRWSLAHHRYVLGTRGASFRAVPGQR